MKQTLTCLIAAILVCPCAVGARPGRIIDPNSADIIDRANDVLSDPNAAAIEVLGSPGSKDAPSAATDWDRVQLSLSSATDLPEFKYRLLPPASDLTDDDAAVLYAQAAEALSEEIDMNIISEWISMSVNELPVKEVEAVVEKLETTFELLGRAARCRSCKWPHADKLSPPIEFLDRMKTFTGIISLRTRLQIAQKQYKDAANTIQTGLGMARHIADGSTTVQALVGQATASVMLRGVEEFIQAPDAPSLYRALQDLPRPLVDLNKAMRIEQHLKGKVNAGRSLPGYGMRLSYGPGMEGYDYMVPPGAPREKREPATKAGYPGERLMVLMARMNRFVAALQCVEGIRFHVASAGQLPESLAEITDIRLPYDPVTNRPFDYFVQEAKAVLAAPTGPRDARGAKEILFELKLK